MTEADISKVKALLGFELEQVWGAVHFFDGQLSEGPPLFVWLKFREAPALQLSGSPDGATLVVGDKAPEPVDMGEAGEILIRDLSKTPPFDQALGNRLQAIWTIRSVEFSTTVGIRLGFGGFVAPVIGNFDDELFVATNVPVDVDAGELVEDLVGGG